MNKYKIFEEKYSKRINEFPLFFAFSDEGFAKGMKKLGVTEIDELLRIPAGGFIRKADRKEWRQISEDRAEEKARLMKDPEFLYQMFYYELHNHEFGYTRDLEQTLEACDLTVEDIDNNAMYKEQLAQAVKKIYEEEGFTGVHWFVDEPLWK